MAWPPKPDDADSAAASPRRGARRMSEIPPEVLAAINRGEIETCSFVEDLALHMPTLLRHVLPARISTAEIDAALEKVSGPLRQMEAAAALAARALRPKEREALACHPSNAMRGMACFIRGRHEPTELPERLARLRPLAADPHFGVREWVWIAVRPAVAAQLAEAIELLADWAAPENPAFIRRFACEVLRPRGVWCAHLRPLVEEPAQALPVLHALRQAPEKYVQDSVANWLNDASKSRPEWVAELAERWLAETDPPHPATVRIVHRATRTLRKPA